MKDRLNISPDGSDAAAKFNIAFSASFVYQRDAALRVRKLRDRLSEFGLQGAEHTKGCLELGILCLFFRNNSSSGWEKGGSLGTAVVEVFIG